MLQNHDRGVSPVGPGATMEGMTDRAPKIYYVTENDQWLWAKRSSEVGDVIEVYVSPPHVPNLIYERTETGLKGPVNEEQQPRTKDKP